MVVYQEAWHPPLGTPALFKDKIATTISNPPSRWSRKNAAQPRFLIPAGGLLITQSSLHASMRNAREGLNLSAQQP